MPHFWVIYVESLQVLKRCCSASCINTTSIILGYSWILHSALGKKGKTLYQAWVSLVRKLCYMPATSRPSKNATQRLYEEDEKLARKFQEEEAAAEREAIRRQRLERLSHFRTRYS